MAEVLAPWVLRHGLGVHVDPDKALGIDVSVKREETVLGAIKSGEILIQRSLGKLTVHTVRPTMVLAGQDVVLAIILDNDGKSTVTADVVKAPDSTLCISDEEEIETSFSISNPGASLVEAHLVSEQDPFL